jgi:23S rRNA (uracil1939-C5)-methyltransferase
VGDNESASAQRDDETAGIVRCEHGERCGGCSLLGVPRAEQLQRKRAAVRAALSPYPGLAQLAVAEVVPAQPQTGYRTRAKLVVAHDGGVGLYARGSHDVVDIPHCRVLAPELARVADVVRELARRSPGALFGADLRAVRDGAAAGVLVTLLGEPPARAELAAMARELAQHPGVLGTAISEHQPDSPAFLSGAPEKVAGLSAARDRLADDAPYHLATHGSFAQAHRAQAAAIVGRVVQGLSRTLGSLRGARVLELYAGSGALGLALSRQGARVLLVERFAPALALAEQAAREQGLGELQTRAGDALHVARELLRAGERFDAVVANPPRRGLPSQLRAGIATLAPRAFAYVSCDPQTLARDLDHLALLGHAPRAVEPFDMVALSDDVECVALLVPAAPPEIRVLHEDDGLLAVDKPPHMPTTPQGDGARSLLQIVSEQRDLRELAAVHRLDAGTSGVCLLAKRRSAVAGWSRALKAGEKQYQALVRGVARDKGSINRPLRDGESLQPARTRYARIELAGGHSLLRVRPEQGRTHQIRRHLAAIGHPVVGDERHGHAASNRHFEQKHGLDRPFLHLGRIALAHPRTGQPLTLESELPGDLRAVLDRLRGRPSLPGLG